MPTDGEPFLKGSLKSKGKRNAQPTSHDLYMALPYWERDRRRRERIAALEAALVPCEWCGIGVGIEAADHSGCAEVLAANEAAIARMVQS